jgi:hypothetical protein
MTIQVTVFCTDRGIANERFSVCYDDGGRIAIGNAICTDRGTELNVTVFVMKTVRV